MESQFDAMKKPNRRVRKRKSQSSQKDSDFEVNTIDKLSTSIRDEGLRMAFFSRQPTKDNNRHAREKAREVLNSSIKMYRPAAIVSTEIINLSDNRAFVVEDEFCMLNSWYRNDSERCIRLLVSGSKNDAATTYFVPPRSTFHIGSVSDVRNFASINGETFDLVVMDPPWENLSVKRQQSYVTCGSPLESVDLECLAADGLVAVWITNRKGIESELGAYFRRWKLTQLATFFWLKVTLEGDPVCSFNSSHKLPYERLVFASRTEYSARYPAISAADGKVIVR
ncbi:MT-A70 protein [Teladorsagia circumcincta]|uniref:MT-A70 protein n=1 Tax=Teladorsagia circumcincta TaxID=45464 RepID=A0A2G9UW41_TELCI|nr:MT-A70 protein [Teladorsagia circumcincta]